MPLSAVVGGSTVPRWSKTRGVYLANPRECHDVMNGGINRADMFVTDHTNGASIQIWRCIEAQGG